MICFVKFIVMMRIHSLLFDDNKIQKIARKLGNKQKESPVWCTGEGKTWNGNTNEESRESKMGIVLELSL